MTGVQGLPAGFQTAFGDLLAVNHIGASSAIQQAPHNAFLPGFTSSSQNLFHLMITPIGPLADLAPVLALPGQMAQSVTNLLAPGWILAPMAQNTTNTINAFTNLAAAIINLDVLTRGLPLQFLIDGMGGPANALSALNSSAVAFTVRCKPETRRRRRRTRRNAGRRHQRLRGWLNGDHPAAGFDKPSSRRDRGRPELRA
jgi:hypothetical protein